MTQVVRTWQSSIVFAVTTFPCKALTSSTLPLQVLNRFALKITALFLLERRIADIIRGSEVAGALLIAVVGDASCSLRMEVFQGARIRDK